MTQTQLIIIIIIIIIILIIMYLYNRPFVVLLYRRHVRSTMISSVTRCRTELNNHCRRVFQIALSVTLVYSYHSHFDAPEASTSNISLFVVMATWGHRFMLIII